MAFTPAHVAAVLPAGRRLARRGSVLIPLLVIGSMAPDFPTYLPSPVTRAQTHSLVGVLTWSALFGLACAVLWDRALSAPTRDLAPAWVRRRLGPAPRHLRIADLPAAYGALAVGGLTHIVWDDFTHAGGWFVVRSALLEEQLGRWPVFEWLQLGTSVVGCAVVTAYELHALAVRSPRPYAASRVRWQHAALGGLGLAFGAGCVVGAMTSLPPGRIYQVLTSGLTLGAALLVAAVAVVAALWWRQVGVSASQESTPAR